MWAAQNRWHWLISSLVVTGSTLMLFALAPKHWHIGRPIIKARSFSERCIPMFHDVWWFLMIFDDFWWFLMIFDDLMFVGWATFFMHFPMILHERFYSRISWFFKCTVTVELTIERPRVVPLLGMFVGSCSPTFGDKGLSNKYLWSDPCSSTTWCMWTGIWTNPIPTVDLLPPLRYLFWGSRPWDGLKPAAPRWAMTLAGWCPPKIFDTLRFRPKIMKEQGPSGNFLCSFPHRIGSGATAMELAPIGTSWATHIRGIFQGTEE